MFTKFDEILAKTLQDIKETKCYGRTHAQTSQRENSIPTTILSIFFGTKFLHAYVQCFYIV